jgi:hypothetical protein
MKYSRTILTVSSFAIAILSGVSLSVSHAQAAESTHPLINTAVAKETTPTQTQDKASDVLTTEQRIAILKEIVASAQDEVTTLTDKLNALQLDDAWSIAKDHFISTLATSSDYYAKLSERINQEDISLDEVKSIAKDLKDWRESTYTPELKEVGNLILIFQTENVRSIVEVRDVKISNDLKKLDRQKLINTDTLKKYLSQAETSIKNAKALNNKAKDLYFAASVSPLQPKDALTKAGRQIEIQTLLEETISSDGDPENPSSPATDTVVDVQDTIRELAKNSLMELKTAYELFFKMNDRIRK